MVGNIRTGAPNLRSALWRSEDLRLRPTLILRQRDLPSTESFVSRATGANPVPDVLIATSNIKRKQAHLVLRR
jgi:hypothetical protein